MNVRHILIVLAIALCSNDSFAQTPVNINVGERPSSVRGLLTNVSSPLSFIVRTGPRRSYCCSAIASNTRTTFTSLVDILSISSDPALPFEYREHYEPQITEGANPGTTERICFTSKTTGALNGRIEVPSEESASSFEKLRLQCNETTLYGKFNTAAGEINFLEITNLSGQDVRVHVRGQSESNGGAEAINVQLVLPASITRPTPRTDFGIDSLVEQGAFGTLQITHDAPPGGLTATT